MLRNSYENVFRSSFPNYIIIISKQLDICFNLTHFFLHKSTYLFSYLFPSTYTRDIQKRIITQISSLYANQRNCFMKYSCLCKQFFSNNNSLWWTCVRDMTPTPSNQNNDVQTLQFLCICFCLSISYFYTFFYPVSIPHKGSQTIRWQIKNWKQIKSRCHEGWQPPIIACCSCYW